MLCPVLITCSMSVCVYPISLPYHVSEFDLFGNVFFITLFYHTGISIEMSCLSSPADTPNSFRISAGGQRFFSAVKDQYLYFTPTPNRKQASLGSFSPSL